MATKTKAQASIARLRALVEERMNDLQADLARERENLSAIDTERGLKAANMMARTLREVMEIERRDKLARERRAKQRKITRDSRRRELAQRIDALIGDETVIRHPGKAEAG
jgi:hypothetical protein